MDLSFSPEEQAFAEDVRAFLAEKLPEYLRDGMRATPTVFVEPDIGMQWQRILYEKGWLAYGWPASAGGPGWTPTQRYIFEKECAVADAPGLPVLSLKLLAPVLYTFGSEAQKARYLPKILSGEHYWCQGFSEPQSGSDLASLKSRARRDGDRYVVNGSKIWTTHAQHANHMFALVRTDPDAKAQDGISFLLIDMDQPGVSVRPIRGLAGDYEVNAVFLDDVVAPVSDRVGEEGQGWAIAKFLLENERGGSCHAPKLLADLDRVRTIASEQPDGYGGALLDDPVFAVRLARLELEAEALEIGELRILSDLTKGRPPGPQTSLTKLIASTLRQDIDTLAMDAFGYAGLQLNVERPLYGDNCPPELESKEAQLAMPRYLNSRAWTIFGGTNEIQKNIIAKTVLNL